MEIIDRVSKRLGLSENEENNEDMITQDDQQAPQTESKETPIQPPPVTATEHKVIDFNSAMRDDFMANNNTAKPMGKSKIMGVCPKNFDDDAKIIADCLREDMAVVIDLEKTNPEQARRIVDFALGTTYAIDGDVQQISEHVFVCTPKTVVVTFEREEPKQERDFSWLTRRI